MQMTIYNKFINIIECDDIILKFAFDIIKKTWEIGQYRYMR